MRVLISSVGTRGDVQPALALGLALRTLGHSVRMCVPPNFVRWAESLEFDARPIGIEMRAPRPGAASAPAVIPDLIADQFVTVAAAAEGCDVIVGAGAHQYAVRSVGERIGVPSVVAVYAPVALPSVDLAPPGPDVDTSDPSHIQQLWADTRSAWNQRSLERVNANRARLGLLPVDDVLGHVLADRPWLAADAALGPASSTPGMQVFQTGAWILPDTTRLGPEVEDFLERGSPPVYIGLGSMPAPAETSRTLIEAARREGLRVILSQGWAELGLVDDAADCLATGDMNQQLLFPRLAAVVHHGGAGTTTTAARAGVPQVVVPMFGDQFYWARRVRELGIGASVPFAALSVNALSSELRHAIAPEISNRARAVSQHIATDGALVAAQRLIGMVS